MPNQVKILNIVIDNLNSGAVLEIIDNLIKRRRNGFLVTANTDHMMKLQKDADFKDAYNNASLVLADGMPLIWASKFLGTPLKEKISGSDLFPLLCETASRKGYSLFFLGGREGAAEKTADVFRNKFPNIRIVGVYSPPFGFENNLNENYKITQMIKVAKPDILFVGLGAPKQEKWIFKHKNLYEVPVSIGIGASFEFVSGFVRRAPVWMQKCGLEWSWRILMEPKRLWRRYLIDDMQFFWLILKQKLKRDH
jgi:N-acetylglucosaminyldiphosphoundecaprenol N-acetyl-beta-D-mannosaminyltransferase